MDKFEEFFEADPILNDEVIETETVETPVVETVEETAEPDTVVETVEEPVAETVEVERRDPSKWAPVAALTAERAKARENQNRIDELERQLATYQQPKPETATAPVQQFGQNGIPDPYDDPHAYHQFVVAQATHQARQEVQLQNLNMSRNRAVEKYGQDEINLAADWAGEMANRDPNFEATVMSQPDPAEWVIAQKKRHDMIKSIETDPDAYVRARAAELGLAAITQPVVQQTQSAAKDTGPKSIVNAKSRNENVSPKQQAKDDFDAFFKS
jgi:hypothetical protein